jgi:YD repeat-containing protein
MYVIELVITYGDLILGSDRLVVTARQPEATVHIYDVEPDTTVSLPDAQVHVSTEVFAVELNAQNIYEFIQNITYEWICTDPCAVINTNSPADELHPNITFTQEGQYSLRLNVYKTGPQLIGWDEVTITVLPENQPPHVEAGSYPAIILPTGGSFERPLDPNVTWCLDDGLPDSPGILSYIWSRKEGPSSVTFDIEVLCTAFTFYEVGEYEFDLRASDDQYETHDTLTIHVYPADQPIHVYAGSDKTVTLPFGRPMDDAFAIIGEGMTLEWSVVNQPAGAAVSFYPSASVQNPLVTFDTEAESDPYELQLAVKDEGQIVDANQVQVWVFSEDTEDSTPPEITTFTATQNNVPIDPCTPVFGDVRVTAIAEDYGSGMASMELILQKNGGEPNTLRLIEDPCSSSPVMRIDYILHTYLWESGDYTLRITTNNGAQNGPVTKELELAIADPEMAGDATAEITNIASQLYNTQSDGREGVRPQVITEGFFELEGIAYHPSYPGQVTYKVDLFKAPAGAYAESGWNDEPLKSDYFVKTMISITDEVGPGSDLLGMLDFTTVPNRSYQLLLTVEVTNTDLVKYASAGFILDCPLKIGNVKFTQEDVIIPVGGVPLRVVRTYDSFNKDRDGEFGCGCGVTRQVRLGNNFARNVTMTLPDGNRATFMFYLEYDSGNLLEGELPCYVAKYQSPPGVTAKLETLEEEKIVGIPFSDLAFWNEPVDAMLAQVDLAHHDFAGYVLTMEDGTQYYFERESYYAEGDGDIFSYGGLLYWASPRGALYLSKITTTSGETIDLNVEESTLQVGQEGDAGIEHKDKDGTSTKAVKIAYYGDGHIKAIYAPSELDGFGEPTIPTVEYVYEDTGNGNNLVEVKKLVSKDDPCTPGDETKYESIRYVYDDDDYDPQDHYITDIIDPRGLKPIRYEYDNDGRLVATVDAKGNRIEISHDTVDKIETVYDRTDSVDKKHPTLYMYNGRGNVIETQKFVDNEMYSTTKYTYDKGSKNPDDVKTITVIMPDEPNAVTSHDYVYYSDGKLKEHTVFDPERNATKTHYDRIGNVTLMMQLQPMDPFDTDPCYPADYVEVAHTENKYYWADSSGDLHSSNPGGEYTLTNLLRATEVRTQYNDPCTPENETGAERTEYKYDSSNRLRQVRKVKPDDPCNVLQVLSTYEYDEGLSNSLDQPYSVTDTAGFARYFGYDDNGNQDMTWYDWVDAADPCNSATVSTITEYDAAGRIRRTWKQVSSATGEAEDYTVLLSETEYNSIGKVDWTINEHGVLTKYEYDAAGNLVETLVYESKAAYDAWYWDYPNTFGGILTISQTLYDAEGRVVVTAGAHDPCESVNGTETVYDPLGRVIETRRWEDVEISLVDLVQSGVKIGRASTGWTKVGAEPVSYSRSEYDVAGRVKSTFVLDEAEIERETRYEYDLAGRQVKVIDPNFNVTETHYVGNMRDWVKDARGNVTGFDYDALGRVIKTTYPATVQNPEEFCDVVFAPLLLIPFKLSANSAFP